MKFVCRDIVKDRYTAPGLIAQGSFRLKGGGSLRAKVLVFEKPRHLQRFFADVLGRPLGRGCLGAVTDLSTAVIDIRPGGDERQERVEVDRRHFCLIGLCREYVTMRVLSHEAVHAGFCYARRSRKSDWDAQAKYFDEEAIAYPAGEVAHELVVFLERFGILKSG